MAKCQFQGQVIYNRIFFQIKLGSCVILYVHRILSRKSIYGIVIVIQGDLHGQKVNLKVKFLKILFLTTTNIRKSNKVGIILVK